MIKEGRMRKNKKKEMDNLLIKNRNIFTMSGDHYRHGDLLIENGKIKEISNYILFDISVTSYSSCNSCINLIPKTVAGTLLSGEILDRMTTPICLSLSNAI